MVQYAAIFLLGVSAGITFTLLVYTDPEAKHARDKSSDVFISGASTSVLALSGGALALCLDAFLC